MSGARHASATIRRLAVVLILVATAGVGQTQAKKPFDWEDAERKSAIAIEELRRMPRTARFFEEAHGYAVLHSATRVGFGIGGAWGKGLVYEGGHVIGRTRYGQFTSGIQTGARHFRMIVFFRTAEDLEYFKKGKVEFVAQAGAAFARAGASADPAYNTGVAVFTQTRMGFMFEATVSGARLKFWPLEQESDP